MDYTQNLHLPQWEADDRIMMDDFNDAMSKLDTACATAPVLLYQESVTGPRESLNVDLSAVDLQHYSKLTVQLFLQSSANDGGDVFLTVNHDSTDGHYFSINGNGAGASAANIPISDGFGGSDAGGGLVLLELYPMGNSVLATSRSFEGTTADGTFIAHFRSLHGRYKNCALSEIESLQFTTQYPTITNRCLNSGSSIRVYAQR